MSQTLETIERRHWRTSVPRDHKQSIDTRVRWLWNQRFGTVQSVYVKSDDLLDKVAATLLLQAIIAKDLESIRIVFNRLEGGPQSDEEVAEAAEAVATRL